MASTLALALAAACATVTSEPAETIDVTTEPGGAEVSVNCGSETNVFTTPARIAIARKSDDCWLTFQKTGFEKQTALLEQGINRWAWGNLPVAGIGITILGISGFSNDPNQSVRIGSAFVIAGLGGLLVDRLTWRLRDHDPKTLHLRLRPSVQETTK